MFMMALIVLYFHLPEQKLRDLSLDCGASPGVTLVARAFDAASPLMWRCVNGGIGGDHLRLGRSASVVVADECSKIRPVVGKILDDGAGKCHGELILEPFGVSVRHAEGDQVRSIRKNGRCRLAGESFDSLRRDGQGQIEFSGFSKDGFEVPDKVLRFFGSMRRSVWFAGRPRRMVASRFASGRRTPPRGASLGPALGEDSLGSFAGSGLPIPVA
jgi:hypothetical protein